MLNLTKSLKNKNHGVHGGTRRRQDNTNIPNSVKLRVLRGKPLQNNYGVHEGTQEEQANTNIPNSVQFRGELLKNCMILKVIYKEQTCKA
jgi:hypothetical protein